MINHKFSRENDLQDILYKVGNWINEISRWIVDLIKFQHINLSTYRSLSRISYIKLPVELKSQKKGPVNMKNNEQKCFYGVMLSMLIQ